MIDNGTQTTRSPRRRLRRIAITIGCIAVGIFGGLIVFVLTTVRRPPPPMRAEDFRAARGRWEANGPSNYEMTIKLFGRQGGVVQVTVEDGEPTAVNRDGVLTRPHTWEHWTVEGLFRVIRLDLEGLDQPERAFGAKDVSQLVQQAEFDVELGYPRRYRRAVLTTGDSIEWEITEFNAE